MRNLKFLVVGLCALFLTNVNALEINEFDTVGTVKGLKDCLLTESTCTLTGDITVDEEFTITSGDVTLDLAGNTLTMVKRIIVNNAKLTITGNGLVEDDGTNTTFFLVDKGGSLILENGTYINDVLLGRIATIRGTEEDNAVKTYLKVGEDVKLNANYGILVTYAPSSEASYGAVVDFYGQYEGKTGLMYGSTGITVNGNIRKTSGNVPIVNIYEGAKITSVNGTDSNPNNAAGPAIYGGGYAEWNISGGEIKGSEALSIKSGKWNITGGNFTAFGDAIEIPVANGNGSEATGAAISITANSSYAKNVELNIAGGTFSSNNGLAFLETKSADTESSLKKDEENGIFESDSVSITGGNFNGGFYSEYATGFIKGGKIETTTDSKYINSESDFDTTTGIVRELRIITVDGYSYGDVNLNKYTGYVDDKIVVDANPQTGYYLKDIIIYETNNPNNIFSIDENNEFNMIDADVTVKVVFERIELYQAEFDLDSFTNGTISFVSDEPTGFAMLFEAGEEVTIKVSPDEGYELNSLAVTTLTGNNVEIINNKFIMPDEDVVIKAKFALIPVPYNVTVKVPSIGSLKVNKEIAYKGEEVTIDVTAPEEYIVDKINVLDTNNTEVEVKDNKFVMPNSNVVVSVVFKPVDDGKQEVQIPTEEFYDIFIATPKNGEINVSTEHAYEGDEVEIEIIANEGYALKELIVLDENNTAIEVKDGKFIMPAKNVSIDAVFVSTSSEGIPAPNTSDNIMYYVATGITSLAVIALILSKKKLLN